MKKFTRDEHRQRHVELHRALDELFADFILRIPGGETLRREYERVMCPFCGRKVAAYVPHRGDGSDVKIVPHKTVLYGCGPQRCPASDRLRGEYVAATKVFLDRS